MTKPGLPINVVQKIKVLRVTLAQTQLLKVLKVIKVIRVRKVHSKLSALYLHLKHVRMALNYVVVICGSTLVVVNSMSITAVTG